MSEREQGCWSFNVAAGYESSKSLWLSKLKEAVWWLEQHQNETNAQKSLEDAELYRQEMNRWFNRANNQHFRIEALVREVKAARQGQAITYIDGQDPVSEDWRAERDGGK